jgi:hypothetical protein
LTARAVYVNVGMRLCSLGNSYPTEQGIGNREWETEAASVSYEQRFPIP